MGDAEYSQDTLENVVKPSYKMMTLEEIKRKVLAKYTLERIIEHITQAFIDKNSTIYNKLLCRLRLQFLREEFSKALKKSLDNFDENLFKDEDFVLSDACNQSYMDNYILSSKMNWQDLKNESCKVAQRRLEEEFYEDDMTKFSEKGAYAILKGMGYLEDPLL